MAAAAFSVNEDAPIGCSRDGDALVNSAARGATRELAPVGTATNTMITEKSDAILALLMLDPLKLQPWKPLNEDVIIRTTGLVEIHPRVGLASALD